VSHALRKHRTEAKEAYREAVPHSQLHSLVAMAYGIAPDEVTNAELRAFLRVFVFVPGICVALVATAIALTAVRRLPVGHAVTGTAMMTAIGGVRPAPPDQCRAEPPAPLLPVGPGGAGHGSRPGQRPTVARSGGASWS
jgi:hypothetical protein